MATQTEETGEVTGTKDKDYNIVWFTEQGKEMLKTRLGS